MESGVHSNMHATFGNDICLCKAILVSFNLKVSEMLIALKANGLTARKFVRGIRSIIIKVAQMNEIEGNLSKNYKLENPGFDQQDLYWVSDFQTFNDDPGMPENVKIWLLDNYRRRFRPTSKVITKQQMNSENA